MAKFDQRNQKIDGDQINVGKDLNIFNNIFFSDTVTAQLWFSITVQWITYIMAIVGFVGPLFMASVGFVGLQSGGFSFFCLSFSCLYTLIFIPHSLFSFFIGLQNNNHKVIGLSVVAGLSPILFWVLFYLSLAIWAGLFSMLRGAQ